MASYNHNAAVEGLPDIGATPLSTNETDNWVCYVGAHQKQRVMLVADTFICEACLFDLVRDGRLRVGRPVTAAVDAELVENGSVIVGDVAFAWS